MDCVLERIDAWLAAGLIDSATAERLRSAEAADDDHHATKEPTTAGPAAGPAAAAAAASTFFGPQPTIVEVFAYLGAGFFIGAWGAFLARLAGTDTRTPILAAGAALVAAVLIAVALRLRGGTARQRRGAGAALLAASWAAANAGFARADVVGLELGPETQVFAFGFALAVAVLGRWMLPALTTQFGLLTAITGLAGGIFSLVDRRLNPCCGVEPFVDNPWTTVILPAVGWLVVAVLIGAIGLREARATDAPAQRRAALTRLWAGLVAVAGLATAVTRSGSLETGDYGRIIEPWIGELALAILAIVLLERAFRRNSAAYLAAAALAVVIALTDFNFRYLSESTDIGLLIEGAILLAVGLGAERLRRRLDRDADPADGDDPASAGAPA
jgi:hypothetical protein